MSQILINRGSDLTFTGTWRDENGAAMNLTGWAIADYDTVLVIQGKLTVSWINAALGTYTVTMQWDDRIGSSVQFRLKISSGTTDITSPLIKVDVQ